jgi:hypothetical protein
VTLLSPTSTAKAALDEQVAALDAHYAVIPVAISDHGLRIRTAG